MIVYISNGCWDADAICTSFEDEVINILNPAI